MRLLIVSHTYTIGQHRKKVAALAAMKGLEVALLTPYRWQDPLGTAIFCREPWDTYPIFLTATFWNASGRRYLLAPLTLWRTLRQWRPELVQVEQEVDSLALLQVSLAKMLGGFRLVFFAWENLRRPSALPLLERFNVAAADGALVGNSGAAAVLQGKGFRGPLALVPQMGVDEKVFVKGEATGLRQQLGLEPFVVGFIGRLAEGKGVGLLLQAVARLDAVSSVVIVGRGPEREALASLAAALSLSERVRFVDAVPGPEIPRYLNAFDVLVLPSVCTRRWMEQFGRVLIEAMACEVPVVGSSSGAIPEVVGEAGVIFPEGDALALAEALESLRRDPARRASLGAQGRQRVLARYTNARIAAQTVAFYREIGCPLP